MKLLAYKILCHFWPTLYINRSFDLTESSFNFAGLGGVQSIAQKKLVELTFNMPAANVMQLGRRRIRLYCKSECRATCNLTELN